MRTLTLYITLFMLAGLARAQVFPVQANLQLTSPYATHLSDYTALGSRRLVLNTFLADLSRDNLQVKFSLKIEGNGVRIESREELAVEPYILYSGIPAEITGADLEPYFRIENLQLSGITATQLRRTGALPEGFYRFSIRVLEYNRGVVISNEAIASAWLVLNDPPVINFPVNGSVITANDPQLIRFQWTPRHKGSPNANFTTKYQFRLVEIWPNGRNPNDAMLSTSPIYETETTTPWLNYGIMEPLLIPGKSYAFQITAIPETGTEQLDLFKNDGKSEVFSFTFGVQCQPPKNTQVEALGNNKARITWEPYEHANSVIVQYRDQQNNVVEEDSYLNSLNLYRLEKGSKYQVNLISQCGSRFSETSQPIFFTTGDDSLAYACGEIVPANEIANQWPISEIYVGEQIKAGDFNITIEQVYTSQGRFTGYGIVEIPFLEHSQARVVFNDIVVNTDKELIRGSIVTYYDYESSNFYNLGGDNMDPGIDSSINNYSDSTTYLPADSATFQEPVLVDSFYVNEQNEIVLIQDGKEQVVPIDEDNNTVYKDSKGNVVAASTGHIAGSTGVEGGSDPGNNPGIGDQLQYEIGPVVITLKEKYEFADNQGRCVLEKAMADIRINLEDKLIKVEKQLSLEGLPVSLEKDCQTGEIIAFHFEFSPEDNMELGSIRFLDIALASLRLDYNRESNLTGKIELKASVGRDASLLPWVVLRPGASGLVSFEYEEGEGSFDFSEVSNINLEVEKGGSVIAGMYNGKLGRSGELSGYLDLIDPIEVETANMSMHFKTFKADVTLDMLNGLSTREAEVKFELSDIPGTTGSLKAHAEISENQISSEIIGGDLSVFGMDFSELNLKVEMDEFFSPVSIRGTFEALHPEIAGEIRVNQFGIENGRLIQFDCSGEVAYSDLELTINKALYNAEQELIELSASVSYTTDGIRAEAALEFMTIDKQGRIEIGDYVVDIDGVKTFGPLTVAISAVQEGKVSNRWVETSAEASFSMTLPDLADKVEITRATISFEKRKNKSKYRNIHLQIDQGNLDLPSFGPFQATLQKLNIAIDHEEDYLIGDGSEANVSIAPGSSIQIGAAVIEDAQVKDLIYLDAGATGDIQYAFSGQGMKGNLRFDALDNVTFSVRKDGNRLAELRGVGFNEGGTLTGRLTVQPGSQFATKAAVVKVLDFDLGITGKLTPEDLSVTINDGGGLFQISGIRGLSGAIDLGFEYDPQGNFLAAVNSTSRVRMAGMELEEFQLTADLSPEFDLILLQGQVHARHDQFDSELLVNQFEVRDYVLTSFDVEGKVNFKGFHLDIVEGNLADNQLKLTGKVAMNLGGSAAWLAVEDFVIEEDGTVRINHIAGEVDKSPVLVSFSSSFEESRFKGSFTGSLASIGLNGQIDIGAESSFYNFAYLSLSSQTNVPLASTGLKLTRFGGHLGYNYRLEASSSDKAYEGKPQEGNYVMGLTLGLADITNMVEVTGNPLIQFGNERLEILLNGSLRAPLANPVLTGNLEVHYRLPENNLAGTMKSSLQVPAHSGAAFSGDFDLQFQANEEQWSVSSGTMQMKLLQEIEFVGAMKILGKLKNDEFVGYLSGLSSYSFHDKREFTLFDVDFTSSFDASMNLNGRIDFDQAGFYGTMDLMMHAKGELGANVSVLEYVKLIELSGDLMGKASFSKTTAHIEGTVNVKVDVFGEEKSIDVDVRNSIL